MIGPGWMFVLGMIAGALVMLLMLLYWSLCWVAHEADRHIDQG